MSRIQRILDKAEREGVLQRTRPVGNSAAPGGHGATALEELEEPRAPAAAAPVEAPHASRATLFPAARAIRSTVLDPYLVAATQGTGIAAEQYPCTSYTHHADQPRRRSTHRAHYQPRTRRGQEPHCRESRPDDGAGLSAPHLHLGCRFSGPAAASAVRPGRNCRTLRCAPGTVAARRGAGHDRGAWADGVASRTATGSSGRASRDLCDATDAGRAEVCASTAS